MHLKLLRSTLTFAHLSHYAEESFVLKQLSLTVIGFRYNCTVLLCAGLFHHDGLSLQFSFRARTSPLTSIGLMCKQTPHNNAYYLKGNNRVMKMFIVTVTKGSDSYYCFKSYSGKHSACRGRLHLRDDRINVDDCCKNGRGYAVEVFSIVYT